MGFELSKILYAAGAKVYVSGRSKEKGMNAIEMIKNECRGDTHHGQLEFLQLELHDLSTIKASAKAFQDKEAKLDVLWNNAGIGACPGGIKSEQGYDIHVGTNVLAPFLFTKCLLPQLKAAKDSRVIWTSSMLVDASAAKDGLRLKYLRNPPTDANMNYINTKVANWYLASEFGRRFSSDGIVSVTQNPGNLKTGAWRHQSWLMTAVVSPFLYDAKHGAFTELWAGISPEITVKDNGRYAIPWGRWHDNPRSDILQSLQSRDEGGAGHADDVWEWCEEQTQKFT